MVVAFNGNCKGKGPKFMFQIHKTVEKKRKKNRHTFNCLNEFVQVDQEVLR